MRFRIRRAKLSDARGIHDAHMRSIRELCSADYTPEQIQAWGGRAYDEASRHHLIKHDWVWVLESTESPSAVCGYLLLTKDLDDEGEHMHVGGLYLVPEATRGGWGRRLWAEAEACVRQQGLDRIRLFSTITSQAFYARMGFVPRGELQEMKINGVPIPSLPMEKRLGPSQRLRVAVYAIIESEGHVLASQLTGGPNEGRWSFPGGGLEFGETPVEALVREIREESRLELPPQAFRFKEVLTWHMQWKRPSGYEEDLQTLALLYEAQVAGRPPVSFEPDGLSSLGSAWISPSKVDPASLHPEFKKILARRFPRS
jgi:ADP-ribose pyrophosphatase YjhB (NUDIX family)/GNAT superfamily N-acetyltransferase